MTMTTKLKSNAFRLLASVVFFTAIAGCVQAQVAIKPTSVDPATFDVIGISVRTNNTAEATANGEIPKLWQRLFMEGILGNIPDRADDGIVAVYTDYASDASGDYTYILGAKVKPGTKAPSGMVSVSVPAGKFLEFVTDSGPGQEVITAAWKQIYGYFQAPDNPHRAFKSDYEIYSEPINPSAMQGHIFIGVK
jgi:predicted transcriptional regulator YdeE